MPNISIEVLKGRSLDEKRCLVQELTDAVVRALGSARAKVRIRIVEVEREDLARAGILVVDEGEGAGGGGRP